jgi:hypothetical protein
LRGDFASKDGQVCVVVGVEGDQNVPEEHVAAWFGHFDMTGAPEVWTIPVEYFSPLDKPPTYCH